MNATTRTKGEKGIIAALVAVESTTKHIPTSVENVTERENRVSFIMRTAGDESIMNEVVHWMKAFENSPKDTGDEDGVFDRHFFNAENAHRIGTEASFDEKLKHWHERLSEKQFLRLVGRAVVL